MINLHLLADANTTAAMNQIESLSMHWVGLMVDYVNSFVKAILPTMIYVITYRIIVFKS